MTKNNDTFEKIRESVDIVEIISKYVSLKKVGQNYTAFSPFKSETKPSFFVSPNKKIFKCFSSGYGGDVIKFVSLIEGISYTEAAKRLAKEYNVDVNLGDEDPYYDIMRDLAAYYNSMLHKNKKAILYLKSREVFEVANDFILGYAPLDQTDIYKILLEKYSENDILSTGLFYKNNNEITSFFKDVLVFPLYDIFGRVFNMQARVIGAGNDSRSKYIFTRGNGRNENTREIYNLNKAQNYIRQQDEAIVTEGIFDTLYLYAKGYKNVVALLGLSFSKTQMDKIKRYTNTLFVIFDSDNAGEKALLKLGLEYSNDFLLYTLDYPKGFSGDIDKLMKAQKDFDIQKNKVLISTYIRKRYEDATEAQKKLFYKKTIEKMVSNIKESTIKNFYLEDFKLFVDSETKRKVLYNNPQNVLSILKEGNKNKIKDLINNDLDCQVFAFVIRNYDLFLLNKKVIQIFVENLCGYHYPDDLKDDVKDVLCLAYVKGISPLEAVEYFETEQRDVLESLVSYMLFDVDVILAFSLEDFTEYVVEKKNELEKSLSLFL